MSKIVAVWEKIGGAWSLYTPEQSVPVEVSDSPCAEADGCPTEKSVLQRFWREAHSVAVVGEPPENAAKSIASMIEEWVQECIKNGGNWQECLPTLIQHRLKRFWPAHSIPAAELERLRECKVLLSESRKAMLQYDADYDEYPPFHHNKLMERIDAAIAQEGERWKRIS